MRSKTRFKWADFAGGRQRNTTETDLFIKSTEKLISHAVSLTFTEIKQEFILLSTAKMALLSFITLDFVTDAA